MGQDLSLGSAQIMLIFPRFEPSDAYKKNAYKKNSAKRDIRPLKGMFNSPIYVHVGGDPKRKHLVVGQEKNLVGIDALSSKICIFPPFSFSIFILISNS